MHSALPVHVVWQSPSHLTLQLVESAQVTVLACPTWSLQNALVWHPAVDPAPSLKSQLELARHVTTLSSPPMPLHSDESWQVTSSASLEFPLHLALFVQLSEHELSPHSVLQSAPAAHVHAESVQVQPTPEHVGASSPPHPRHAIIAHSKVVIASRMVPPRAAIVRRLRSMGNNRFAACQQSRSRRRF
jgi:hypothetical protein